MFLYEDDEVKVLLDTNKLLISVGRKWKGEVVDTNVGKPKNLMILSEWFRDEVGLGKAKEILTEWGVSENSPLWYLGRKQEWKCGSCDLGRDSRGNCCRE